MLMIRLQRVGRKNDPSFRVVVVDSREAAQTGKVIEVVGSHDARVDRTELKAERIKHWLSVGAKTSNTVNNLLIKKGIVAGKAVDVSSKKLGKKASASAKATADEQAKITKVEEKPIEEVKVEEAPVVTEEIKEEPVPSEAKEALTEKID